MIINIFLTIIIMISLSVIMAGNPVNSVIGLILIFIISALYFIILGINYIAFLYLIIYVGAIAILFLFVVMMMNVRFCREIVREAISFNSCSDGILITELTGRESLKV